jgi:hypothetical protein
MVKIDHVLTVMSVYLLLEYMAHKETVSISLNAESK